MNTEKWRALVETIQDSQTGIDGGTEEGGIEAFMKRFVLPYAPPETFPKVLDLGCGPGTELKVLQELGYTVTGLTFGKENIEYSTKHYGITPSYGDIHDLPFPPESFDVVLCRQVFEHSFAPWLLALEVWIVLRMHGRWVVSLPDPRNKSMWTATHPSLLYPKQMEFLFQQCGFNILLADTGKVPWTFEDNGHGEPYDYVMEKAESAVGELQKVLTRLKEIHSR